MASSVSLGTPAWCDGGTYSGLLLRQFWAATKTYDNGTPTAVAPAGGVFPGGGSMQVLPPATGLTVTVAAGYCSVPHPTAGDGAYIFGAMTSGVLTIAANASGSIRLDLIIARVYDLSSSSSYCTVEVTQGTPGAGLPAQAAASILLAVVAVTSGLTSILTANITDERAYVVPPGCIIPIPPTRAAPASPASQVMFNVATGTLVHGTGVSGLTGSVGYIQVAGTTVTDTSSTTGLTPGTPAADPWGIGHGQIGQGGGFKTDDTDGTLATEMSVTFVADGTSDYEVYYKWQLAFPVQAFNGGTQNLTGCGVTLVLLIDGVQADSVYLGCSSSPLVAAPGGSASWFTSGALGSTLDAGTHTAVLAVETSGTYSTTGPLSGVFIGDVNDSGGTVFGAGSGYLNALTKENCLLRIMGVAAA